ncbi:TetR family transcriptional regulator C-terminal domain-containing protein [Pseudomonas sp. NA-150]|uniref:TetR/AcrR family transcriptional regulator n=1 Tax=Pseudomonas sp. NA-150 TaxID=3367525 RepID=UPI0037C5FA35
MSTSIRLDKRDLILAKGAHLMTRRGYHGTGVLEIVQAAGIPKGSFYHYFASKEDFAVQALEHLYEPRLLRYAAALSEPALGPRERVLSFYRELVVHFSRQEKPEYHCFIGSLSFEMADDCQPIARQVENILERSVAILAQCLMEARDAGELQRHTDCSALAEFIANAWEGALMRMKVRGSAASLDVFLNQLERLLAPGTPDID